MMLLSELHSILGEKDLRVLRIGVEPTTFPSALRMLDHTLRLGKLVIGREKPFNWVDGGKRLA